MILTKRQRTRPDFDKFPATQLFLLGQSDPDFLSCPNSVRSLTDTYYAALIRVSEPIAITSIFPYAWKLVLDFQVGDRSNASFYAGILISAFSLAEASTGMWVKVCKDSSANTIS